jgi:hypothetical protein
MAALARCGIEPRAKMALRPEAKQFFKFFLLSRQHLTQAGAIVEHYLLLPATATGMGEDLPDWHSVSCPDKK